uniref:Uncharacterized protein n=1 Tax=Glossina palpalis gambiensis TaxID=67801 RepID=A0A1B0BD08_9MUSC
MTLALCARLFSYLHNNEPSNNTGMDMKAEDDATYPCTINSFPYVVFLYVLFCPSYFIYISLINALGDVDVAIFGGEGEDFMRPVHKLKKKQNDMIAFELFLKVLPKPEKNLKKRKLGVSNLVIWADYNGAKRNYFACRVLVSRSKCENFLQMHFDLACKLCLLHALAIMLSLYHNDDHHNDFGVVGTQYLIANSCKLSTKGHRYRQPRALRTTNFRC